MIWTGLEAMGKVLVMSAAGVRLRRKGLLPPEMTKALSTCFLHVFLPCLLATRVAVTMDDSAKLGVAIYLWSAALSIIAAGWGVGLLLRWLVRPPAHFRDPFVVSIWNSNSNSLPIALVRARMLPSASSPPTDADPVRTPGPPGHFYVHVRLPRHP
jgi:predicted permease